MSEEIKNDSVENTNEEVDTPKVESTEEAVNMTQKEFNDTIQNRLDRQEKKLTKEFNDQLEELKKEYNRQNMTPEEQEDDEKKELQEKIEKLEHERLVGRLEKQVLSILSESGINAEDELVKILIAGDEETTEEVTQTFVSLFNSAVQTGVDKALEGSTPKKYGNSTKPVDVNSMTYAERVAYKQSNPKQYESLIKGE